MVRENGVGAALGHEGAHRARRLGAVLADGGNVPIVVRGGLQPGEDEGAAGESGRHEAEIQLVGPAVIDVVVRGGAVPAELGGRGRDVHHAQRGRLRTGSDDGDGDIVHKDATHIVGVDSRANVAESDVVAVTRDAGLAEIDGVQRIGCARHGNRGHRHEGGDVHRARHHAHLQGAQHVGGEERLGLAGVELDPQVLNVLVHFRGHENGRIARLRADFQISGAGIGVRGRSLQHREQHIPVVRVLDDTLLRYRPTMHHAFRLEINEIGSIGGRTVGHHGNRTVHILRNLVAFRRHLYDISGIG